MIKSKFFKNCLALLLITLVAGFALACVNEVTEQPIADAENQARLDAYEVVFSGADFVDENALGLSSYIPQGNCTVDDVLTAKDKDGNTIGYVMSATSPSGYGGDVTVAVGVSCETNTITGFTVLSHSETAGLGARCTEDEFQAQFAGKSASGISYVKGGGATTDTEIDAISGATITSNAVTEAVNAALDFYNNALGGLSYEN
jgi:electron transport complex protein RnfG